MQLLWKAVYVGRGAAAPGQALLLAARGGKKECGPHSVSPQCQEGRRGSTEREAEEQGEGCPGHGDIILPGL